MAFCGKCGTQVNDGIKFCPSCGGVVSAGADPGNQQQAPPSDGSVARQADPKDAEQNKVMAILAYIIFFIPLLTGDHKKSPFVMYHTNQGTLLFLAWVASSVVSSILAFILIRLILGPILFLVCFVFLIIGIINAANGKMSPLPVIGKYTIIK